MAIHQGKKAEVIGVESVDYVNKTLTLVKDPTNAYTKDAVVYHRGRSDRDLMRLEIHQPAKLAAGEKIRLKNESSISIRLWRHPTKRKRGNDTNAEIKFNALGEATLDASEFAANSGGNKLITLWIECTEKSKQLRDVSIVGSLITAAGVAESSDRVKATAAWVEIKRKWLVRKQASGLPDNPDPDKDLPELINSELIKTIELSQAADGSRYGFGSFKKEQNEDKRVGGRILWEFEVTPDNAEKIGADRAEIQRHKDNPNEESFAKTRNMYFFITFDITRQAELIEYAYRNGNGAAFEWVRFEFPENAGIHRYTQSTGAWKPPQDPEAPQWDLSERDEQDLPVGEQSWVFGGPARLYSYGESWRRTKHPAANRLRQGLQVNFRDFVRAKIVVDLRDAIGETKLNDRLKAEGSRCSPYAQWQTKVFLKRVGASFAQDAAWSNSIKTEEPPAGFTNYK